MQYIVLLNSLFFLFYGLQCLVSDKMALEFKRFGLPDSQRLFTGILQLLGAIGMFMGLFMPIIGLLASGGLALMMFVAFLIRMKTGDDFIESAQSLIFLIVNSWISWSFFILIEPSVI